MKAELSNTNFNGTLLIPVEIFNYKFSKKYEAAIKNDKKELAKIVKQHVSLMNKIICFLFSAADYNEKTHELTSL
jgi:hypothetical protein